MTAFGRPWLSVVMPVFNGEPYIAAALESLCLEDPGAIHCIVVDDGSTDRSLAIVDTFVDRMSLTVYVGVRRRNWVAATNEGLRRATLEHACFLHQDDVWLPGRLSRMRRLVDEEPAAALWVQGARFLDQYGRSAGRWALPTGRSRGRLASFEFVRRLLVQNFLCIAAPVFRVEDAMAQGGLDESLWYTADWDLWLRLAATGPVAYERAAGVGFRVHPASQTSQRTSASDDMRDQLARVLERHLDTWRRSESGPDAELVERLARTALNLNVALAAATHQDRSLLLEAVRPLVHLPPSAWSQLLRSSRLVDRVAARVRIEARRRRGR